MEDFVPARKKKQRKTKISLDSSGNQLKRIKDIKFDVCSTQFFTDTVGNKPSPELVCYGLGNFAESYIARYQLALLLALREELQIGGGDCEIYDPQFTPEESSLLLELNFQVLQNNQEGKRECSPDTVTIFYMPHCGKALYNNLLWRNWGCQLENVVIIGNSFTHMIDSTPTRILERTANYVIKIQPFTQETPLQVPAQYEDVFNNTSIHTFSCRDLENIPHDLWQNNIEPVYDLTDAEIIFR
ncbi:SRR1-like protein isoform X2 [Mercenaria mercenaria]|uniref:SRR1-like protein isoform X2 n=1 Tax=Mercenaria mercenaria TaxID=6596 RepID=UPI00234E45FF|nr:SRR1-like protein isoform X2 [Mercenaria mercenaria]